MAIQGTPRRAGIEGRTSARRGQKDRVVCVHEPDEVEAKPVRRRPIVSVDGEDVDPAALREEKVRRVA